MRFELLTKLANDTPTSVLCDVWGASSHYVDLCKLGTHQMTLEEAGELAALHGLKLPDLFAV
jgi:hypothetical protein